MLSLPAQQETAASAPRGKPSAFYRPELDALRFFAFLGVFVVHGPSLQLALHAPAWQWRALRELLLFRQAGAFGLHIFFLLSSYLITELLLRERALTGTVHLRAFYARRILRIWPLYYFVVFAGILLGYLVPGAQRLTGSQIACLVFFVGWIGRDSYHNGLGSLWSISIEELFYLIWPTVAKIGGRRFVIAASLAIVPLSLLAILFVKDAWGNPLVQFLFFATGALLAVTLHGKSFTPSLVSRFEALAAGCAGCWIAGEFIGGYTGPISPAVMTANFALVALSCTLIFLAFYNVPSRLVPKPVIYLGKISYGLYVFHPFALVMVAKVLPAAPPGFLQVVRYLAVSLLAFLATVLMAACSYHFFERPILRFKERFAFIPSRGA